MSYPKSLDEYTEAQLRHELARREAARAEGACDYCGYPRNTSIKKYLESIGSPATHATDGPCRFPERHGHVKTDTSWEDYDSHGLIRRSCNRMRVPHHPHDFDHADGRAHCWGRDPVPADAVEKYTTPGCDCEYCTTLRTTRNWPRHLMCDQRWEALPLKDKQLIHESIAD